MDGQRGKDGRATRCDVERHGHAGDADRDLAVGRRGRFDVDRTRSVDIVGKDGPRVCSEQLSGDEDACDDGAVLLLHGGVGDDALVDPTVEDLECLAARGGNGCRALSSARAQSSQVIT